MKEEMLKTLEDKLAQPLDLYNDLTYMWSKGYRKAIKDCLSIFQTKGENMTLEERIEAINEAIRKLVKEKTELTILLNKRRGEK